MIPFTYTACNNQCTEPRGLFSHIFKFEYHIHVYNELYASAIVCIGSYVIASKALSTDI